MIYKYFISFSVVIGNQTRAGNGQIEVTREFESASDIQWAERYLERENGFESESLKINNFILFKGGK